MPGLATQNYAAYPYYARSIASIMPGRTRRDNGHKGLVPVITCDLSYFVFRISYMYIMILEYVELPSAGKLLMTDQEEFLIR